MKSEIIVDELKPENIKALLRSKLREYNHAFLGHYQLKPFAIYTQDDSAEIMAGLSGFVLNEYASIRLEFVWVKEDVRHQGLGSKLIQRLTDYARSHKCRVIQVSTMEFQGPSFYEKMGFERIGTIPKWFCNKDEVFFVKKL